MASSRRGTGSGEVPSQLPSCWSSRLNGHTSGACTGSSGCGQDVVHLLTRFGQAVLLACDALDLGVGLQGVGPLLHLGVGSLQLRQLALG